VRLLLTATLFLLLSTPSYGFTLKQVVELVKKRDLKVKIAKEQLKGNLYQKEAVKRSFLPQVNLQAQFQEFHQNFQPEGWNQNYAFSVTVSDQPVNFQQFDQLKLTDAQIEQAKANLENTTLEEMYQALSLAFQAAVSYREIEIRKELLRSAEEILKVAEEKKRKGLVMITDVLKARAEVDGGRRDLIEAENRYRKLINQLEELLNAPLKGTPQICLADEEPRFNEEELLKLAYSTRPELKAQRSAIKSAQIQQKIEEDALKPTVNLSVSASRSGSAFLPSQKVFSAGVTLNFPLFDSGVSKARALAAGTQKVAEELQLQLLKNRIKREVLNALSDVRTGYEKLKAAESSLRYYEKAYERSLNEYRLGVSDVVSLLQSYNALKSAQEQYLSALLDYNLSLLNLQKATGQLLTGGTYEKATPCPDSLGGGSRGITPLQK